MQTVHLLQIVPMFLKLMIDFVATRFEDEPTWKGYFYMICIMVLNFAKSITVQWYFYLVSTVGLRIRTALNCAIYCKALRLCPSARKTISGNFLNITPYLPINKFSYDILFIFLSVGETVNLMSVDTQRFMDLLQVVAGLWSTPFTVILCQLFLWQQLGVSSFAGLAVIILTIPLNRKMAEKLKDLQERNMKNKDERMKTMNEVLDSIKVLKLYTRESSFAKKIKASRAVEINALKKIAENVGNV